MLDGELAGWTIQAGNSEYMSSEPDGYAISVAARPRDVPEPWGRNLYLFFELTASNGDIHDPQVKLARLDQGRWFQSDADTMELVLSRAEERDGLLAIAGTINGTVTELGSGGQTASVELQFDGQIRAGGS